MRNIIIKSLFFTVSAVLGLSSCSKDSGTDDPDAGINLDALTQISVSPDRTRILLENPLSGWVLYSGIGSGLADNFWETYDNFSYRDENGNSGTLKVSDYSNVLYIKAAWSAMNPEEGVYIWEKDASYSDAARRLKYLVDGAKERGMKIAFTINTNSEGQHSNYTPDWVREKGCAGYWTQVGSANVFSGYPDNEVFQEQYGIFVKKLAEKYNDPDEVEFISGLGIGKWGECHSFKYECGDESKREDVYDWATSLYANSFTNVPVVTNYHKVVGRMVETSSTADELSETMLQSAIDKGFSMRHDAFGMKSYYGSWERSFIAARKYEVPVLGEGGGVQNSHDYTGDYATERELREGEYDEMAGAFVNMMDLRYSSNTANSETYSWFNTAFDLVEQFLQEGVYRLYPNTLWLPESVNAEESLTVRSRWSNLGNAYFPADLKQWQGKYKMAYALLDNESGEAIYTFVDSAAQLQKVVKNSMQTFDTRIDLSGVSAGDYTWGIAIVNTQKDNTPAVGLSCRESDLTDSGWLKLMSVTVN